MASPVPPLVLGTLHDNFNALLAPLSLRTGPEMEILGHSAASVAAFTTFRLEK